MSQNWDLDPSTGDYVMEGGSPVNTESLTIPAYIRLKVKRGTWLYAPDATYGSDLYLIKKRRTTQSPTNVETAAAAALQPLLDDGRASEIDVTAIVATRNAVGLQTTIIDARGEPVLLEIPSLGV